MRCPRNGLLKKALVSGPDNSIIGVAGDKSPRMFLSINFIERGKSFLDKCQLIFIINTSAYTVQKDKIIKDTY